MKTCMYCGTPNEDTAQACIACGSELPKPAEETPRKKKKGFFGKKTEEPREAQNPKICPICAAENPAGETRCSCCGSELKPQAENQEPVYCTVCGMENPAGSVICESCGCELEQKQTDTGRPVRKSAPKLGWVKWAALAAVVVGLVTGGTAVLLSSDAAQVNRGGANLGNAFTQKVQQLGNLKGVKDHFHDLTVSGEYSVTLRIDTADVDAAATMHYDMGDKIMDGKLSYGRVSEDVYLDFDFSSDNQKFMLASDRLTADIYGFKLEDFKKTPLAKLLPLPVNEKGELDLFQDFNFDRQMENKYGDYWKKFIESVAYNEINERDMTVGGVTHHVRAFEVTWDTRALVNLAEAVLGKSQGFLGGLTDIVKAMEPDCRMYINGDHEIVALDFVAAGNKCLIEFAGTGNPWEQCIISSQAIGGKQGIISGYVNITDDGIQAQIHWRDNVHYGLSYDDKTGDFRFVAQTPDQDWELTGKCTSANGSAAIEFYGTWGDLGRVSVSIALEPLEKTPEHLARKYVDLMDMDSTDWQRLLIELSN